MDIGLFDLYWTSHPPAFVSNNRRIECKISLKDAKPNQTVRYLAAAPPDTRTSFSGSGLPSPNIAHAFSGGHTCGSVDIGLGGSFKLTLPPPNSVWSDCGRVLIPPTVYVAYLRNDGHKALHEAVLMHEVVPFRDIQHAPHRTSPVYYLQPPQPVMTQEAKLRRRGYKHCVLVKSRTRA